jgi:hypothetical protein
MLKNEFGSYLQENAASPLQAMIKKSVPVYSENQTKLIKDPCGQHARKLNGKKRAILNNTINSKCTS